MPPTRRPIFPEEVTNLSARLAVVRRGRQVHYFNESGPLFVHDVDDLPTFRMITSQFHVFGVVTQTEIVRTFGVTKGSVQRAVKLYREKGSAGFYAD